MLSNFQQKYLLRKNSIFTNVVNVSKNKEIAKDYGINISGVSRQLPTLIMFEEGEEICRFPAINDEGKIGKVLKYDKRILSKFFDLESRYLETMNLP
jgi:thioredoxin-like negative regulator of GroEL